MNTFCEIKPLMAGNGREFGGGRGPEGGGRAGSQPHRIDFLVLESQLRRKCVNILFAITN